jgi:hypothetical protein
MTEQETFQYNRMLKKLVQQGRSEWRPEAYPWGTLRV